MSLETAAMRWLRWDRKYPIAICERSPRSVGFGQPDVLGVTKARYLIEIEIKRSMSDFRADATKLHRANRHLYLKQQAKQFYYLVPGRMEEAVAAALPDWAGLMVLRKGEYSVAVVKPAPVNPESKRLSVKECCRLVHMVAQNLLCSELSHEATMARLTEESGPWEFNWHYQI
jgi:hypothetical protein